MQINPTSLQSGSEAPTPGRLNQLSQDDFIKLMLTQLRLQSPQNPFDSNAMMQQMSQLTTLSATQSLEKTVNNLNTSMQNTQVVEASHLIGKKVQIMSSRAALEPNGRVEGDIIVPQAVDSISLNIKDKAGNVVKTLQFGGGSPLTHFEWDGLDNNNKPLPAGSYTLEATGMQEGKSIGLVTATSFTVQSVSLDSQGKGASLQLGEFGAVQMQDVLKIF